MFDFKTCTHLGTVGGSMFPERQLAPLRTVVHQRVAGADSQYDVNIFFTAWEQKWCRINWLLLAGCHQKYNCHRINIFNAEKATELWIPCESAGHQWRTRANLLYSNYGITGICQFHHLAFPPYVDLVIWINCVSRSISVVYFFSLDLRRERSRNPMVGFLSQGECNQQPTSDHGPLLI